MCNLRIMMFIILFSVPNIGMACTWQGDLHSHKRYGIDIGFVGKVTEQGKHKDHLGNVIGIWATFKPVKVIRGKWKLSKRFYFDKKLDITLLLNDAYYVIHADNNGNYVEPCFDFAGLQYFHSVEEESYLDFAERVEDAAAYFNKKEEAQKLKNK